MRKYRRDAATPARVDFGNELVAGLLLFPETSPAAPAVEAVTDELEAAFVERRRLRKALVRARAGLRLGNYVCDQTLRGFHSALKIADGGREGPLTKAMYPGGLTPVVAPGGSRQAKPTKDFIDRLTKCRQSGIDGPRAEWQPRLAAALAGLETALAVHGTALDADAGAYRTEVALREDHFLTVDKTAGLVRAAFPGDRARQDVVFPQVEDDEGPTGGEGEGGGGPATPAPTT